MAAAAVTAAPSECYARFEGVPYMQPEEFRQFFDSAYGGAAKTEAEQESDARIAQVYDLFVGAKVMRR